MIQRGTIKIKCCHTVSCYPISRVNVYLCLKSDVSTQNEDSNATVRRVEIATRV